MDYTGYAPEDFAADEYFVRWVKRPDAETSAFWEGWLAAHPGQAYVLQEARELVLLVAPPEHLPTEVQVDRIRRNVHARTGRRAGTVRPVHRERPAFAGWRRMADVFVALCLAGVLLWWVAGRNRTVSFRADYAQTRTVLLPDSSRVVLNANSTLRYGEGWDAQTPREVWLDGEAFCDVTHQANHQPFVVHSGEVAVEVLGTTFNVWRRDDRARIVLCTGKIRLRTPDQPQVELRPGQLAEVPANGRPVVRNGIDTGAYTAWKKHQLVFDHAPLREVARLIEDQYGYRVQITGPLLPDQELTLKLPQNDLDILLQSLEKLFDLKADRHDKTITLEPGTAP